MFKKIIFTNLIFLISLSSLSQLPASELAKIIESKDEAKILENSTKLMYEGLLVQSEILADELLKFQSENSNYNFRKGFLIKEIRKDYNAALLYLKKAILNTKPQFDAFSTKEINAPADAFYHLAICYHRLGNIDSAVIYYNQFINNSTKKSGLNAMAKIGLQQTNVAKEMVKRPVPFQIENLGPTINSPFPDYCAVASLDGNSLYYTSKRPWKNGESNSYTNPINGDFPEDIYVSRKKNNTWQNQSLLPFCLPNKNEASVAISADERLIYLYQDSSGAGDLYSAQIYPENFGKIDKITFDKLNTPYWETHCAQSVDGNTIYFSSDRPGGFGGRDLYVMFNIDDKWTKPENLGSQINSAMDEDSPFFSNGRLFYSSNGERSIGGFDIFVATENSSKKWESQNMGYPLNGFDDDLYYTETTDGQFAYFTSTRSEGFGDKDIYRINLFKDKPTTALVGHFVSEKESTFLSTHPTMCEISCLNCAENENKIIQLFPDLTDGNFKSNLLACRSYRISFLDILKNETFLEEKIEIPCESTDTLNRNFLLVDGKFMLQREKFIHLTVKESIHQSPISMAHIKVVDEKDINVLVAQTDQNGQGKLKWSDAQNNTTKLKVIVSKEGYDSKEFYIENSEENFNDVNMEIELAKELIACEAEDKSIYFDLNSAKIDVYSMRILDKYIDVLRANPDMIVEISAHTDCSGSVTYNNQLSQKRAKATSAYILKYLKDERRIRTYSYGESKPKVLCNCDDNNEMPCSMNQHAANRRTEIKITSR